MNILLAVDGSEYTKRMLAYLAAHEELLGKSPDITAITVVAPIPGMAAGFLAPGVLTDYYREEADKVLHAVIAFGAQQGWKLQVVKEHGPAAQMISACAEKTGADLIVMGSNGYSTLSKVLLGSVATGVMARSGCPVLLIR